MSGLIEIRAQGAATIRRPIDGETLVIGQRPRDAASGIAVPHARELSDEHLIVSLVRDRFHVALAAGARIEPQLNGNPFKQVEVPFGAEIRVGSLAIRFTGEAKKTKVSPVYLLAGAMLVGFLLWSMLDTPDEASLNSSLPAAPPLFEHDTPCPYNGVQALARGTETEQAAMAHAERYSFDPYDGITAVQDYRLATSCYTSGGDSSAAARARAAGQRWQTRLETRYQGHQLRLRLALDRHRPDHALREVRSLKKLLRGKQSDYIAWLKHAEHRLTAP
jgi:hypothetical protein